MTGSSLVVPLTLCSSTMTRPARRRMSKGAVKSYCCESATALVVRCRVLLPPELHTLINSFIDAPRNWELDLENMVTFVESSL